MDEKILNFDLWRLWGKGFFICLTVFLFSVASIFANGAADEEVFEASAPFLISEAGSTRALAINPDNWKDELPDGNSGIFPPGSRVMVFVTNIDLLAGEGANAFRVFAADADGKKYRLTVEALQPRRAHDRVYRLTLRIHDFTSAATAWNGCGYRKNAL